MPVETTSTTSSPDLDSVAQARDSLAAALFDEMVAVADGVECNSIACPHGQSCLEGEPERVGSPDLTIEFTPRPHVLPDGNGDGLDWQACIIGSSAPIRVYVCCTPCE